jgi:hypothetical protein
MNSVDITLKVKEQKVIAFTFKDASGTIIPLTGCTFALTMENSEGTDVITKVDIDFDKTQVAVGIVKVTFTVANLTLPAGEYVLELKTIFTTGEVDKSKTFNVNIIEAITV